MVAAEYSSRFEYFLISLSRIKLRFLCIEQDLVQMFFFFFVGKNTLFLHPRHFGGADIQIMQLNENVWVSVYCLSCTPSLNKYSVCKLGPLKICIFFHLKN